MAEVTSGAVSSLLALLQNEAQLLSGVGSDVDFIREEMESMNSFLEHLSRTAHLTVGGGQGKQVRTWMKQVRDLAHDCSNGIDFYLQSGDLAVHLAKGGLRRYVWWTYWPGRKMVAQHKAAMRLRQLKDRVSDVGKRRLRYGVEIPGRAASGGRGLRGASIFVVKGPSQGQDGAAAPEVVVTEDDDDDDDDDDQNQAAAGGPDPRRRGAFLLDKPRTLEDFCAEKLVNWWFTLSVEQEAGQWEGRSRSSTSIPPSISIVAPDADISSAAAQGALGLAATHFEKSVCVNLQALHHAWDLPLLPEEVLFYILRECKQQGAGLGKAEKYQVLEDRQRTFKEIWQEIDKFDIDDKISKVKTKIGEVSGTIVEDDGRKTEETKRFKAPTTDITSDNKPLGILHRALRLTVNMAGPNNMIGEGSLLEETIVQEAVDMLKLHMEGDKPDELPVRLDDIQYKDILRKAFPDSKPPQPQETSTNNNAATTLGEDHIKEILNNHKIALENHKVALDIIRELLPGLSRPQQPPEGNSVMEQAKAVLQGGCYQDTDAATKHKGKMVENDPREIKANSITAAVEETKEKVDEVSWRITDSLMIKAIVDKINELLQSKKTLIILIDGSDYISQWERIRNALSLLTCASGSAAIVITMNSEKAKEFCCPPWEPITYSLVGMYHDIVLKITGQREDEGGNNNSQIFREILDKCDTDEFCMRMFSHALYANPNRGDEELRRLNGTLQVSENSRATDSINARMILKFSYKDLPREHKACLLYLAIFPQGHIIKRSTLIERWAIEELMTKEDWPTLVRHAKRCFEALIDRQLVMPVDISAAGKVKSCMVGDLVHGFITKTANKEHILDTRLSQLQARHFSTSSGLRLRASDTIDTVVKKLHPKYLHKLQVLKLLDLEGCHCLDKNHLKDICSMLLRLKYLSLRGTGVSDLPGEINNLHELEVLDIRQTKVPERATRRIVILKLRRLLAGQIIDPSTSHEIGTLVGCKPLCSAVQIPRKINRMENMEVLSNVKAYSRDGAELKEIRKLGQLRKLGVAINNNENHVKNLLWAISDLKECLQSLSITILGNTSEGSSTPLDPHVYHHLIQPPKVLQNLTIHGFTNVTRLLTLLARGSDELSKVTLSHTFLEVKDLDHISGLPKLHCIRLRHNAFKDEIFIFKKEEFPHLKNFIVEWLHGTEVINFENGAGAELEKIVLFHTNVKQLCGVGALPKLKELELKGTNECFALLPEDRTATLEPVKTEDKTTCAETVKPEGGTSTAELVKPEGGTTSVELVEPEDGATSAEPVNTSTLTFKKEEFKHLKYFLVQGPIKQTDIKFEGGAPDLEKIVLSDTNIKSLVGATGLAKLREVDLKGNKTFLSFFAFANHISKVTLSDTLLKQDDLQILAKKPKLCFLELLDNSFDGSELTFNQAEFPMLKLLVVKCLGISKIGFEEGATCKLEKLIWSFNKLESLSGIAKLKELKELEFNGDSIPLLVRKDINAHNKKLIHNKLQHQTPEKDEESAVANKKSPFFSIFQSICG